ncbi:MAG: cyclase dehydrase [Alphaproteobacteria bacterium]|nr:cyclase dehydrase [Alphaproteobacteria bacterium]
MARGVPRTALSGRSRSSHDRTAKGLGYFSIALGLAELLAPGGVGQLAGLDGDGNKRLIQAYGLREIATGVAILASHDATPWIWARVSGDAIDIATVAALPSDRSGDNGRKPWALAALLAVTALDVACAVGLTTEKGSHKSANADYRNRSGFPQGLQAARGSAVHYASVDTMRTPEALQPWGSGDAGSRRSSQVHDDTSTR